jgi:hypothetical protein
MASDYDPTEFIDGDFQTQKSPFAASPGFAGHQRAPTIQEVDSKVLEQQQKLAELKKAQEEKERELASLEETRRRQMEFQTGRQELIHNLTRGLGLLEEAEFNSRRDAEQMAKALVDLRDALTKIEAIREESWSGEDFPVELTRSLTTLENARMEWNSARLKFPVLTGQLSQEAATSGEKAASSLSSLGSLPFGKLCRVGLGLTWPLAVVGLIILASLLTVLLRR